MSSKKIFFLSVMNGAAWGGSEELWYQSALWCANQGIETGVCCFDWETKKHRIQQLEFAGCSIYLLPGKEKTRQSSLLSKSMFSKIMAAIPFEEYETVIINQGGWKDIAYHPFRYLFKRINNYWLLYHNYSISEKISPDKRQLLRQWAEKAAGNLGASSRIFQSMKDVYQVDIPRQQTFINPIGFDIPANPESYPGPKNGHFNFSVFAALDIERKAQDHLVEALSDLAWLHRNWKLHLYGEGKDRSLLQGLVQKLQLEKRVFLHGNAANYREAISQSHLVLQVTRIDAMPISVLEAMAMAKPLVVSDVGDMPGWIKENVNGWVSPDTTIHAVLNTLEKAWEARGHWEEMGKNSFEIIKSKFPQNPIEYFLRQCNVL